MNNQSASEQLSALPCEDRNKFIDSLSEDEAAILLADWRGFNARQDQIAPEGDWDIWLCLAGRGWGKTRTGAEWVKEQVEAGCKRIALVAETQKDLEEVMIEGESGILSLYSKADGPVYRKKPVQLMFKTGAIALGYNATQPDQLRGPQFDAAWSDELAKWRYARETWDQLQFGLRLGNKPRQIVTTTPRPIELIKAIISGQEGEAAIVRGRTLDNSSNLPPAFLKKIMARYDGTRLGRQELNAEILGDIPNALWTYSNLEVYRVNEHPELGRVVVAVDPAISDTETSDEHGIIVIGLDQEGLDAYLLEDGSIPGSPLDWARRAVALYDKYEADAIIAEVNQGGDMVESNLKTVRSNVNVIQVRASRGKHIRAEPIASLYEQGRVHHVGGFDELEKQMTMMTSAGYEGSGSPDRLDALVWGASELFPDMVKEHIEPIEINFKGWS